MGGIVGSYCDYKANLSSNATAVGIATGTELGKISVFLQMGHFLGLPRKLLHDPSHSVYMVHLGAGCVEVDHDQVPRLGGHLLHHA